MDLIRPLWTDVDRKPFLDYLKTFEQTIKIDWARKILNTNLPLLAMPTKKMDDIVKEIRLGNSISFLDLCIDDYYETIAIQGKLICKISDFDVMKHYLDRYATVMENWAHVDLLSFDIQSDNQTKFLKLSDEYSQSKKPFIRRLSLMILFQMVKDKKVLEVIFQALRALSLETDYYVIMMAGWLLSECIILYKDETLSFINNPELNPKVINKGIQKCRESRRLTQIQKDALLPYKRKKNHEV